MGRVVGRRVRVEKEGRRRERERSKVVRMGGEAGL